MTLKGATTFIASPSGKTFRYDDGVVGLATSGSGDVLAGVLAGLAARGTDPLAAAVWAVVLHAQAGQELTRKQGALGFLARELPRGDSGTADLSKGLCTSAGTVHAPAILMCTDRQGRAAGA